MFKDIGMIGLKYISSFFKSGPDFSHKKLEITKINLSPTPKILLRPQI